MALTPDNSTALVTQFMGAAYAQDAYDVDPAHALYAENIDYALGQNDRVQCGTRRGVSQVAQISSTDGRISRIGTWFFSYGGTQGSIVAMYSVANGVRFYVILAGAFSRIIMPVTGAASATFVSDGLRMYTAFCDSTGRKGTAQGYVYGLWQGTVITSGGNDAVDTLFASPIPATIATVATSQPGAGVVTAGTHRLAYIFTTRNGYTGALNPVTAAGVFAPASFTAADGTHNRRVVITWASIPTYLNPSFAPTAPTVQIAMTSAANPAQYFLVPGAIGNVPGSAGTTTIDLSITDNDLVTGTDVTQYQNLLTAVAGAGPFNPSSIFQYSSRMAYVTLDSAGLPVVYFSDQNAYQSLTAAFHGVYLEGRQIPVHGASMGGLCYIATLAGLYSTQDNGGYPTTWTPPARVDGSVGVLAPSCMLAVGGKILLASEKGLYLFRGGAFPQRPISYWQGPDWNRINWLAPTQVQVVDDSFDNTIRVLAPVNAPITGATNTNPIAITTAVPHLFQTGLTVAISGVGGNTAANTTQAVTVTGPTTYTIPVAGNGTYTSGGVSVPSTPNAVLCWNYSAGDDPGQPWYSIHSFTSYRVGSMATIRNINTNEDETWFAPATSNPGNMVRRVLPTDALIHRDVDLSGTAAAINCPYETSLLPGVQDESDTLHDYHGAHFRVTGSGSLALVAYGIDHVRSSTPLASPIALSPTPGLEYLVKWFLRNEQQSIRFSTNAVDSYFAMALIRAYYSNSLPMR